MMVKAALVFLGLMILVALIGRALFPSALPKVLRKGAVVPVCPSCGRYLIGQTPCDCKGRRK